MGVAEWKRTPHMDDKTVFHCEKCYQREKARPKDLEKRCETTELFTQSGVYEIIICDRCGGIMKPHLREVHHG